MCKPHRCPHLSLTGNICVYCPGGPDSDFEYSTQSYTGYEPTSMRAIRARYHPFEQARGRIDQLKMLGHSVDKVLPFFTIVVFVSNMEFRLNISSWEELLCVYLKSTETGLLETCMMLYLAIRVDRWMKPLGILFSMVKSHFFKDIPSRAGQNALESP